MNLPMNESTETDPLVCSPDVAANGRSSTQEHLTQARRLLYVSHFFAQFSERAWQFALILFLAAFTNYKSLILVSSYGLVSGMTVCLMGSTAGQFVDSSGRLLAAQRFIWTENTCVLLATAFCYVLLSRNGDSTAIQEDEHEDDGSEFIVEGWLASRLAHVPLDPVSIFLLVGIHVLGSVAQVLDNGFTVAIEKDWIVVLSETFVADKVDSCIETVVEDEEDKNNSNEVQVLTNDTQNEKKTAKVVNGHHAITASQKLWLSETNVNLKQIDLGCKMAAPAVAGFVIALWDRDSDKNDGGSDLSGAALFVGVLNALALVVEYICTARVYNLIPALAKKETKLRPKPKEQQGVKILLSEKQNEGNGCCLNLVPNGLRIYLEQSVSSAGLALSLLYMNALSFGAIMTAYLVWRGMSLDLVGTLRGLSAALGLLGTVAYGFSVKRLTLVSTGMWSILLQFACLSMCLGSLFVKDFFISMTMLVVGVCASRVGLWTFDIAVTQLMQEFVPEHVRGIVGGTQQALNAFFLQSSFGLGLLLPDPEDFPIYVAAGYSAVALGMLLYTFGIFFRKSSFLIENE